MLSFRNQTTSNDPEMRAYAAITAITTFFPEGVLTNEGLANEFRDFDVEKIHEKTGISTRRVVTPEECASDLGVAAAERLFESGKCGRDDIDFLLFCTQSPDYFLPTTACLIQDRLGLRTDCGAIDFNQGCSGFVYGLALAKGLIESGSARTVLLITAETYTKHLNQGDRSVRAIFGDGAAATLVTTVELNEPSLGPFVFGTDGRGAHNLMVPGGGFRKPLTADSLGGQNQQDHLSNGRTDRDLYMNGPEIFNFTLRAVPRAVKELANKDGRPLDEFDLFVFHQANKFMLEALRDKLKIPADKFWIDMENYGNTVSSTIPIALKAATERGQLRSGSRAMLVGFGVGYSWAATMMRVV